MGCAVSHTQKSQYRPIVFYQGMQHDVAEVAADLFWSQPARFDTTGMLPQPPGLGGLNPDAQEFVPNCGCSPATATIEITSSSFEGPFSLGSATKELEETLLRWLHDGRRQTAAEKWLSDGCESTDAGSGAQSGAETPKSSCAAL